MGIGLFLITLIANVAIGYVLQKEVRAPAPPPQAPDPAGFDDIEAPTSTHGRAVPYLAGTSKINGNVIWYGTFLAQLLPNAGGHYYYLTIWYSLANGVIDRVLRVDAEDEESFNLPEAIQTTFGAARSQVQNPELGNLVRKPEGANFPEPDATRRIMYWNGDQSSDVDLEALIGLASQFPAVTASIKISLDNQNDAIPADAAVPVHKNDAWGLYQGFIGVAPRIPRLSWVCQRAPKAGDFDDAVRMIGDDANPVCVIYELLVDTAVGAGVAPDEVHLDPADNVADFKSAAAAVVADAAAGRPLGVTVLWESQKTVFDVINNLLDILNAVLRSNTRTGKLEIVLLNTVPVASQAVVDALPRFDESNILEMRSFTPGTADGGVNEVRVEYVARQSNYKVDYEPAIDQGGVRARAANYGSGAGVNDPRVFRFHAIKDANVASYVASRELALLSLPPLRVQFEASRRAHRSNDPNARPRTDMPNPPLATSLLNRGDAFFLFWPQRAAVIFNEGEANERIQTRARVMRITNITPGTIERGAVVIEAVEDRFVAPQQLFLPEENNFEAPGVGEPTPGTPNFGTPVAGLRLSRNAVQTEYTFSWTAKGGAIAYLISVQSASGAVVGGVIRVDSPMVSTLVTNATLGVAAGNIGNRFLSIVPNQLYFFRIQAVGANAGEITPLGSLSTVQAGLT